MISYINIFKWNADQTSLIPFALVEPSECWFELCYYDIGEFEIYAPATPENLAALKKGNFVGIPNENYVWLITSIQYEFNASGSRMISAKGFEAKWLLTTRIIYTQYNLPTNLAQAVFELVKMSIGQGANAARKIKNFIAVQGNFSITIDETQAPRADLSEFVLNLLKSNKCGSIVYLNNGNLEYNNFQGIDRSSFMIFSQSMDNLLSSTYFTSDKPLKTFCLVESTTTQNNQTVESVQEVDTGPVGIERREFLLSSNISTKTDTEETTFGSAKYKQWQAAEGKNALAEKITDIQFEGEIDLKNSRFKFGQDFFIGDQVLVRDEYFGFSAKARVTKYIFKQTAAGYGEEAEYGNE